MPGEQASERAEKHDEMLTLDVRDVATGAVYVRSFARNATLLNVRVAAHAAVGA